MFAERALRVIAGLVPGEWQGVELEIVGANTDESNVGGAVRATTLFTMTVGNPVQPGIGAQLAFATATTD